MYLHKKYDSQRFHSVAKLEATNTYVQKKNLILEQQDQIKEQRRAMQTALLDKKLESTYKKAVKKMPQVVVSSKLITADKKNNAHIVEMQKQSAEGVKKSNR